MEGSSSNYFGLVAVAAASGSVVLVALEAHRRLISDFRKKFEHEIGGGDGKKEMKMMMKKKKKVRFAKDVVEPSSDNKEYRRRHLAAIVGRTRMAEAEAEAVSVA